MSIIGHEFLLILFVLLATPGLLVLLISRKTSRASVIGLLVSALACLLVLGAGLPSRILPDFASVPARVVASAVVIGVSAAVILRELRREDRSLPEQMNVR
jgi:uncharacterized membrane protein YccC